tara:strand:- start:14145 stop:15416 length:1272 start_codon:yes stop_codon:yes gene_type:complete
MVALAGLAKAMSSLNQGASMFSSGLNSIQGLFSGISSAITSAGTAISSGITGAIEDMKKWWDDNIVPIWDDLETAADTAITAVSDFFTGVELPDIFTSDYWLGEEGVFTKIGNWSPDFLTTFSFETPAIFTSDYWFGEDGVFDKIGGHTFDFLSIFSFDTPDIFTSDYWFGEDGVFTKIGAATFDFLTMFDFTLPDSLQLVVDFFKGEGAFAGLSIGDRLDLVLAELPQPLKFIADLFQGLFDISIGDFIDFGIELAGDAWDFIQDVIDNPGGMFEKFKTETTNAFTSLATTIGDTLKGPINTLIESINSLFASVDFSKTFSNPVTGTEYTVGMDLTSWQIPMLAEGGIVNGPTLAMIGEAGPEAVVPLDGKNTPGGQTFNITVNPSGITDRTDKREMARQIGNLIQQEVSRALGGTTMRGRM